RPLQRPVRSSIERTRTEAACDISTDLDPRGNTVGILRDWSDGDVRLPGAAYFAAPGPGRCTQVPVRSVPEASASRRPIRDDRIGVSNPSMHPGASGGLGVFTLFGGTGLEREMQGLHLT